MDARGIQRFLKEAEGRPYGYWRRLSGAHRLPGVSFTVDHVQGDVYAPPSRLSLRLPLKDTALARAGLSDPLERLACEDLALREFARMLPDESVPAGDAAGGHLATLRPGPEILPRSAARIEGNDTLVLRFTLAFPGDARKIMTEPVTEIFFFRLPALTAALANYISPERLAGHLAALRGNRALREALDAQGLCAFLADGSMLARDGHAPLKGAKPFRTPEAIRTVLSVPEIGNVSGLGIPKGLTVIVGPAFHGKTTLLEALSQGVFDHISGDGRERCASLSAATFPCVEEDRAVRPLDLSFFVQSLPGGNDPHRFTTKAASGATSQAAAILESLASESRLLLLDEDASAANLLTRDPRISALFSHGETLVPLAERVQSLVASGVSLVVVAGASSRWLDLADHVFVLEDYQPTKRLEFPHESEAKAATALPQALPLNALSELFELGSLPPSKIRLSGTRLRLGDSWSARLPSRGFRDARAKGAAHILLAFLRHSPDASSATLESLKTWHAQWMRLGPDWPDDTAHDLEMPTLPEVLALVQRLEKEVLP